MIAEKTTTNLTKPDGKFETNFFHCEIFYLYLHILVKMIKSEGLCKGKSLHSQKMKDPKLSHSS